MTARRTPVIREERTAPTAQTVAHLRPNAVSALLDQRLINEDQARAAEEIRQVYEAVVGTQAAVPVEGERIAGGIVPERLARLGERIEALWRHRYRPWAILVAARRVQCNRGGYIPMIRPALDLIALDLTPTEIAAFRDLRPETALATVVEALDRYSRIAGSR